MQQKQCVYYGLAFGGPLTRDCMDQVLTEIINQKLYQGNFSFSLSLTEIGEEKRKTLFSSPDLIFYTEHV